jgi:hypothetical protein
MLHAHKVLYKKLTSRLGCVKKIGAKNKDFIRHVLSFLQQTQKISMFHEIVQMHIVCQDVHGSFFVGIFNNWKHTFL